MLNFNDSIPGVLDSISFNIFVQTASKNIFYTVRALYSSRKLLSLRNSLNPESQ